MSELAKKHGVPPNMIAGWKRQAIEGMAGLFDKRAPGAVQDQQSEVEKLHAKIGQLVVERDFFVESVQIMSAAKRKTIVEPSHGGLSITRQCMLLSLSRSSYYFQPAGETEKNLALMRLIDAQFLETPWYGSRQMARHLRRQGWCICRKRVRRLMRKMGLQAIYQAPRLSDPHPEHMIHPYLLKGLAIEKPNHVWCADITYIPMRRGFLYLVAIMAMLEACLRHDATRKVLSWRLSNTMDADFCVKALEAAITRYGRPEIFNTDQGSQFTGFDFIDVLKDAKIKISMDGKGRWMDNVFIERLWRSLKYECVYLHAFETGSETRAGIGRWIEYYNTQRPHSSLGRHRTPIEAMLCKGKTRNWRRRNKPDPP